MVHEWAHLRWGVFNESPTPGYESFYYDSEDSEEPEATRYESNLVEQFRFIMSSNRFRKEISVLKKLMQKNLKFISILLSKA